MERLLDGTAIHPLSILELVELFLLLEVGTIILLFIRRHGCIFLTFDVLSQCFNQHRLKINVIALC
jgi:hypothetical protein